MGRVHCCVPNCTNYQRKAPLGTTWHSFPRNPKIRKQWVANVRRCDLGEDISSNMRVCSAHFNADDFKKLLHSKRTYLKPEAVPTIFAWTINKKTKSVSKRKKKKRHKRERRRKRKEETNHSTADQSQNSFLTPVDTEVSCSLVRIDEVTGEVSGIEETPTVGQTNEKLWRRCHALKEENTVLLKNMNQLSEKISTLEKQTQQLESKNQYLSSRVLSFENIRNNDRLVKFYTGLPNADTFCSLFDGLRTKAKKLHYWHRLSDKCKSNRSLQCKLTETDMFFLTLCQLRLAYPVKELARLFNISPSGVTDIFTTWINFLYHEFKEMFKIPHAADIKCANPQIFHNYPDTTLVIDCCDMRVQTSTSLTSQCETFSRYKHYKILKYLIAMTPSGLVYYVSPLYDEACSDKKIVHDSGLLDVLSEGHNLMAAKGFEIDDILPNGVGINVLSKCDQSVTADDDDTETNKFADVRVDIDRLIRRARTFRILSRIMPVTIKNCADQIVSVCSFLSNFKSGIRGKSLFDNIKLMENSEL